MLVKENTGLIVVDIQGKLARLVHDSSTLISNCEKLIKGVQALHLPIIWLEQNPDKLGSTVEELCSLLSASSDEEAIVKFTFDACEEPQFMQAVNTVNVDNWLICGIEAHICVYQTALNLKSKGMNVHIVGDCVSSRTLDNKNLAMNKLINKGAELTGLEMCLFELVKDCRTPEFKEILTLIK
jgi:nicotinamidase-related amidase